jgi:hypothetical protein
LRKSLRLFDARLFSRGIGLGLVLENSWMKSQSDFNGIAQGEDLTRINRTLGRSRTGGRDQTGERHGCE